jgi:hypothetical protein
MDLNESESVMSRTEVKINEAFLVVMFRNIVNLCDGKNYTVLKHKFTELKLNKNGQSRDRSPVDVQE